MIVTIAVLTYYYTYSAMGGLIEVVLLYRWPDCPDYLAHLNNIGCVTWALCAAIKQYLLTFHIYYIYSQTSLIVPSWMNVYIAVLININSISLFWQYSKEGFMHNYHLNRKKNPIRKSLLIGDPDVASVYWEKCCKWSSSELIVILFTPIFQS